MLSQPLGFERKFEKYNLFKIYYKNKTLYSVHDAGRTQIEAGSLTVLALGPECSQTLDNFVLGLEEIK